MDIDSLEGAEEDSTYFNEPPERDIGPDTSRLHDFVKRDVILRDLRQMANDYTGTNLANEMTKMKKLEHMYALTGSQDVSSTLQDVEGYKTIIREKMMIFDELAVANANLQTVNREKGQLAITDGSGPDRVNEKNIDVKLTEMEKRIREAMRIIEFRGTDPELAEALQNYHEVFKQTMGHMDSTIRGRPPRSLPKITNFRQFIEDTERTVVPDQKHDPEVMKTLKILKHLNRYDTLSPNKLPYIPELPYNYEEELAHLDMTSNDILEDIGVQEDVVEISLPSFLKHVPDVKPAKSIIKKIEASDQKKKKKTKTLKEVSKVWFHCEPEK